MAAPRGSAPAATAATYEGARPAIAAWGTTLAVTRDAWRPGLTGGWSREVGGGRDRRPGVSERPSLGPDRRSDRHPVRPDPWGRRRARRDGNHGPSRRRSRQSPPSRRSPSDDGWRRTRCDGTRHGHGPRRGLHPDRHGVRRRGDRHRLGDRRRGGDPGPRDGRRRTPRGDARHDAHGPARDGVSVGGHRRSRPRCRPPARGGDARRTAARGRAALRSCPARRATTGWLARWPRRHRPCASSSARPCRRPQASG